MSRTSKIKPAHASPKKPRTAGKKSGKASVPVRDAAYPTARANSLSPMPDKKTNRPTKKTPRSQTSKRPKDAGINPSVRGQTLRKLADTALQQARELTLLERARNAIISKLDMPSLLRSVVESIADVYGYTHVSIYLLEGEELVLQHQVGYRNIIERIGIHEGVSGRVMRAAQPVLIEDVTQHADFLAAADGIVSEITVPLMDGDLPLGTLSVESTITLTEADLKILVALGTDVSLAIGRARLYEELKNELAERKLADNLVRSSEERLQAVMEGSQLGYSDWNIKTGDIQRNERWAGMLGYTLADIHSNFIQWEDLLHPDDRERALASVKDHLEGRTPIHRDEYRLRAKDGSYRWILDQGRIIEYDDEGHPLRMTATHTDITEKKLAEEVLQKAQQRLRVFFNQSLDGFFFCDFEEPIEWKHAADKEATLEYIVAGKRFTEVNEAMLKQYGLSREAFLKLTTKDVFAHDLEQGRKLRRELFDQGHLHLETYERTGEGKPVWFEGDYVCLYDEDERITGFFGIQREITDRKNAEHALRESGERYRTLVTGMLDGVYRSTHDGKFVDVNPAMVRMFGYGSREEMLALDIKRDLYFSPEERQSLFLDTGQEKVDVFRMKRKDGSEIWVEDHGRYVHDEQGNLLYHEGILRDITDRLKAEDSLRASEARFRALFDDVPIAIWEQDFSGLKRHLDSLKAGGVTDFRAYFDEHPEELLRCEGMMRVVEINQAAVRMYEAADKQELITATMHETSKGEFENGVEEMIAIAEGRNSHTWEGTDETLTGRSIEIRMNWSVVPGHEGDYSRVIVTTTDITERKRTEEALLTSEKTFRGLFNSVAEAIYIQDAEGRFLDVNEGVLKMYGHPKEFFIGKTPEPLSAPGRNDLNEIARAVEATFKGKPQQLEFWGIRSNGEVFPKEVRLYKGTYFGKDVVIALAQDITERKKAEEAIKEAEEKYRGIFENAVEGIYQSTPEGRFRTVNPAFAEMMGYNSPQEMIAAITNIADQIYHDPSRRADFMRILSQQGNVSGFEYQMSRRDGGLVWVSENARMVRDAEGRALYYEGLLEDITVRKENEQRIQTQLDQLNALHVIENAINSNSDLRMTLEIILREVTAQLGADAACVLMFNKDTHTLDFAGGRGFLSKAMQHTKLSAGEGYAGRIIHDRKTIHIPDLSKAENNRLLDALNRAGENFAAYVGCALVAKGQAFGVLEIFQRSPLAPNPDWFDFLALIADQTALAIDNARLFENIQRSNFELTLAYDATIEGWSRALDLRDRETEGHTRRVTDLTIKLARQMGIPDAEILHIRRGALLHDIGKMGIPDHILNKPDELTPEEWHIMRNHTSHAYKMLSPIKYLQPALDIPRCHHEKWDGTGYPDGLKGEQIPIAARIFAVVDVWDALTSNRPYRDAWSNDEATEYIRSESGRHFDSQVVETFLSLISTSYQSPFINPQSPPPTAPAP